MRREGISIPASAIVYKNADAFVQAVEGGRIKTIPVLLGARDAEFVEIVSGLTEGQEIVSRAGTFVADGDMVKPVRAESTGAIKP